MELGQGYGRKAPSQHQSSDAMRQLPYEVIQLILLFLPISSIHSVLLTSKFLYRAANESTLWRACCKADFRYWDEKHDMRDRWIAPVRATDWKALYRQRAETDRDVTGLLDQMLVRQTHHISLFEDIARRGYDAKDTLLRHINVSDDALDVLARRYYGTAVLGFLHRKMAIQAWLYARCAGQRSIGRAIFAFNMFRTDRLDIDFEEASIRLNDLVEAYRDEFLGEEDMSTRARALALNRYLCAKQSREEVDGQEPCFSLGLGLGPGPGPDPAHGAVSVGAGASLNPARPIATVAWLCLFAEQLGLNIRPLNSPFRTRVIVLPPPGVDLDGRPLVEGQQAEPMFLDSLRSDGETKTEELRQLLRLYHTPPAVQAKALRPAPVSRMVVLSALTIVLAVHEHRRLDVLADPTRDVRWCKASHWELDSTYYGALWALIILCHRHRAELLAVGTDKMAILIYFLELLETRFPEDVCLVDQEIIPLFRSSHHYRRLVDTVRITRASDVMPKIPRPRNREIDNRVLYRVGQVFRHRRYRYLAVIVGWDVECSAGSDWIRRMGINALPKGRNQSFYHVMVDDRTARYVAQENIEPCSSYEPPADILPWAGRYFKRWDPIEGVFVSNLRDEYPDD